VSRPAIALLRKDLRITRIFWLPMAFSYSVFLLMFMEHVSIYLAAGSCLAFVAAATALGIDNYYQSAPMFAALPGTRNSLVGGRYLSWGVVTTACLGLFLACTALLHAGFGERAPRLASLVSIKGAAVFLIGTVLAGLIYLPFHFRFGFWRGLWLFIVAGLGLSVIALQATRLLVPADVSGAGPDAALPGPFASLARGLRSLAWLIDRYMDKPMVIAAAAAFLALSIYLSYRLSVGFYRKRDL